MKKYNNEESGVGSYCIGDGLIVVKFKNATKEGFIYYVYAARRIGQYNFNEMVRYAEGQKGLSSYIGKNVQKKYTHRYTQNEWNRLEPKPCS